MKRKTLIIVLVAVVVVLAVVRNFIFSTTMSKPTAMKLFLPKESEKEHPKVNFNAMLTLLLYNDNKVFAFQGLNHSEGNVFTITDPSFRKYLIKVKTDIQDTSFTVVIKPHQTSTYKGTVDALDEMTINDIKKYTMVDPAEEDNKIIDSLRKR